MSSNRRCVLCGGTATAALLSGADGPFCVGCMAVETVSLPSRGERLVDLPSRYGAFSSLVTSLGAGPDGRLWRHQGLALQALAGGSNVVVSTGTASGKSLVFQVAALDVMENGGGLDDDSVRTRVAVFYPTKALASDQLRRWREALSARGMPAEWACVVDGDVAVGQRSGLLARSRVALLTPDVCQAWLLRTMGDEAQREFLWGLRLVVIDEAHVYEGVFGSNAGYLFRRLVGLASGLAGRRVQVVGASATVRDAGTHMEALTGLDFKAVGEGESGAPSHGLKVHHLAPPAGVSSVDPEWVAELAMGIVRGEPGSRVIVFRDSRQGVERVVQAAGRPERVVPHRSGYLAEDRRQVEEGLWKGELEVVVATSALELGIDIPSLDWGINVGLPTSRKSLRQRMGRVGRSGPGEFVLFAKEDVFSSHGDRLADYLSGVVEGSPMNLDNEHIRYRHGLCLRREMALCGMAAGAGGLPRGVKWPAEFGEVVSGQVAAPGGSEVPQDTAPHLAQGLRSSGEEELELWVSGSGRGCSGKGEFGKGGKGEFGKGESASIGRLAASQGMREAYPGGLYRHWGRTYQVSGWVRSKGKGAGKRGVGAGVARVKLEEYQGDEDAVTRPIVRRLVRLSGEVYRRRGPWCELVKCEVIESVEGYVEVVRGEPGEPRWYGPVDLGGSGHRRVQRSYWTVGLHLRLGESSSGWDGEAGQGLRSLLGHRLLGEMTYRRGVSTAELVYVTDNVLERSEGGWVHLTGSLVLADRVAGSLGLSGELFGDLEEYSAALGVLGDWVGLEFQRWLSGEGRSSKLAGSKLPGSKLPEMSGLSGLWGVHAPGSSVIVSPGGERCVVRGYGLDGGVVRYDLESKLESGLASGLESGDGSRSAGEWELSGAPGDTDYCLWEPSSNRVLEYGCADS